MAAQFEKHFVQDLQQDIRIRQCGTIVFKGDNESNIISVDLYNGQEEYSGGGTVVGACICPDGYTVPLTGSISGKTASVVLTGDCFAFPGQIGIGVQIVSGEIKTTVLKAIYNVELFETDTVIDPGSRITLSVTDLIQDINDALAEIPASDTNLKAAMAPVFSTSTAYQAGEYAWYEGQLYVFTADHAAGTWVGTDAALAGLGDGVHQLETSVTEINGELDQINETLDDVQESDTKIRSSVAPVFSASAAYNAGTYVWYEGQLYKFTADHAAGTWTGTDATAVAVGSDLFNQVNGIRNTLDSSTVIGDNKFNNHAITTGKIILASGSTRTLSAGFFSDFIPVTSGTTLYIQRGLGSNSYPTCVFYNENKQIVSNTEVIRSTTEAFTTVVPSGCYYLVVNGSTAYADQMYVYTSNISGYKPYQLYPNGYSGNALRLYSAGKIYYSNGTLFAQANIRLITYDKSYNLGKTINVGTGIWLFWNNSTHTLFASDNYDTELNENIYFVCGIGVLQPYSGDDGFSAVLGFSPLVELDLANNKLYYKGESQAYIYIHSARHTIAAQTAEFNMTNYTVFYYDLADKTLKVTNDYDENASSRVVLLERLGPSIKSITPYILITNENANAGKTCVCYGDSLTWYDGHPFTWGPQEGTVCVGYESYLRAYNGMTVTNRGQSGKTTPQICTNLKSASDLTSFDYLILMGGDNDDRLGVDTGTVQPVGGTFDTNTVAGALQSAIEYALAQKPTLRIILMTEPMGWTYENNALDRVSELIPNTYRNVAKLYGLPLIDLWNESGVNELTRNNYYLDPPDTTNTSYMYHPDNTGWRQISKIICNEIKQY